jgi:hypothetical protein
MKRQVLLSILLAIVAMGYSQTGFEIHFGDTQWDWGRSAKQTLDGGYVVTGTSGYQLMLAKITASGAVEWVQKHGSAYGEEGLEVIETNEGEFVMLSNTEWRDWGDPYTDIFLVKTTISGDFVWARNYGGPYNDRAESFCKTRDGGYAILGFIATSENSGELHIVKTDGEGVVEWIKLLETGDNDYGRYIQQAVDGGYILLVQRQYDYFLIKTDSAGGIIWTKPYDISANQVIQSNDTCFMIVGAQNSDLCIIKTDFDGNILWTKTIYRPDMDYGRSINQTSDGGYIIAGSCDLPHSGSPYRNVYLVKTNSDGDTLWTRSFGGEYMDFGESVQETRDQGFIVAGTTVNFGASGFDVYVIKTDSQGLITGIEERITESGSTLVYPNPTKDRITIESETGFEKVEIYNIFGTKVLTTVNNIIDLSSLTNGAYVIKIIGIKGIPITIKRIVKQK